MVKNLKERYTVYGKYGEKIKRNFSLFPKTKLTDDLLLQYVVARRSFKF